MNVRATLIAVVLTLPALFSDAIAVSSTTNRLVNPGFETNVNGWEGVFAGSIAWDSRRDSATVSGGSLRFETRPDIGPIDGAAAGQCISIPAGAQLRIAGRIMIPGGQTRTPTAGIGLRFHNASQPCFSLTEISFSFLGSTTDLDTWTTVLGSTTAPPGTDKVDLFLTLSAGEGTGSAQALWDTMVLVTTRAVENDLTNDALNDLLWRQPASGKNVWWSMDGPVRAAYGYLLPVLGTDWSLAGSGYVNADFKPDLFWRNSATGQNLVWLMDGTTRTSYVSLLTVPPPWEIGAIESFDADDDMDIVWRNPDTGQNVLWTMAGTTRLSYTLLPSVPGAQWRIAGAGDLDGDGKADLVWRNYSTGQNIIWFMNGATRLSYVSTLGVTDTGWRISAVTDLNADGKADLVWRHAGNGQNLVWFMDGATRTSYAHLPPVTDLSWEIQGSR